MNKHPRKRNAGYTLLEVVMAAAVVAVGLGGAVSLSSSMMAQEELTWRVAVSRNYQENWVRLWQLGLTGPEITGIMPSRSGNDLANLISTQPSLIETGVVNEDLLANLEGATCSMTISTDHVSSSPAGATHTITAYRPTLR